MTEEIGADEAESDGRRRGDFIDYFYFTRMECMVVGALAAVAVFRRREGLLRARSTIRPRSSRRTR